MRLFRRIPAKSRRVSCPLTMRMTIVAVGSRQTGNGAYSSPLARVSDCRSSASQTARQRHKPPEVGLRVAFATAGASVGLPGIISQTGLPQTSPRRALRWCFVSRLRYMESRRLSPRSIACSIPPARQGAWSLCPGFSFG